VDTGRPTDVITLNARIKVIIVETGFLIADLLFDAHLRWGDTR
jgi:hypothetical protein